jgi:TRAP-type C4-dicarboxylate transport system substrate-binding protein
MTRLHPLVVMLVVASTAALPEAQTARTTLRLASLAPARSVWDNSLQQMRSDWQTNTAGRVQGLVYPSGRQGNEATVLLKLKSGTLDGATLVLPGLCQLDDAFNVFGIPFFLESFDELNYMLDRMTPVLKARLEARGFVLLGWGHAGWIRVFSTKPVRTLQDLQAMRMFTSAGSERMVQIHQRHGMRPIALAETQILTGLSSGMIDPVPTMPTAMLFFQWYTRAPYMLDVPLAPFIGATVITRKAWLAVPEADRPAVADAARVLERRLQREIPRQDDESVEVMRGKGVTVSPGSVSDWRREGERYAADMKVMVPDDVFALAVREREAYRAKRPSPAR